MSNYGNYNQQPAEQQLRYRNPDYYSVVNQQLKVRRAGAFVKDTAEKRGFDTFRTESNKHTIEYKSQYSTAKLEGVKQTPEVPQMSRNMVSEADKAAHELRIAEEAFAEQQLADQREQLVDEEIARSAVEAVNMNPDDTSAMHQNSVPVTQTIKSFKPQEERLDSQPRTPEELAYLKTAHEAVQASYEKAA